MGRAKHITPQRRERMAKALQLRKDGATYAVIGEKLGISPSQAHDDVTTGLFEVTRGPAEELLELELQRNEDARLKLSAQIACVMAITRDEEGRINVQAIEEMRRLLETQLKYDQRRHRLLGLDSGLSVDAVVDVDLDATVGRIMGALTPIVDGDVVEEIEAD